MGSRASDVNGRSGEAEKCHNIPEMDADSADERGSSEGCGERDDQGVESSGAKWRPEARALPCDLAVQHRPVGARGVATTPDSHRWTR